MWGGGAIAMGAVDAFSARPGQAYSCPSKLFRLLEQPTHTYGRGAVRGQGGPARAEGVHGGEAAWAHLGARVRRVRGGHFVRGLVGPEVVDAWELTGDLVARLLGEQPPQRDGVAAVELENELDPLGPVRPVLGPGVAVGIELHCGVLELADGVQAAGLARVEHRAEGREDLTEALGGRAGLALLCADPDQDEPASGERRVSGQDPARRVEHLHLGSDAGVFEVSAIDEAVLSRARGVGSGLDPRRGGHDGEPRAQARGGAQARYELAVEGPQ